MKDLSDFKGGGNPSSNERFGHLKKLPSHVIEFFYVQEFRELACVQLRGDLGVPSLRL